MKMVAGRISGNLAGLHVNMAERLSLVRKSLVVVVGRALGLPVVLHVHAAQLHHFYRGLPKSMQWLIRRVFSMPTVCIVLGDASKAFLVSELRVPPERIEIVINGVPEPVVPRREADTAARQRVLFLGNLSERKGVSDLLRALALPILDRARLDVRIVGGGDIQLYQRLAEQLGVDKFVHFEGWADQSAAAHQLATADVLVLPSYDEGLPLVILEALANGVAVVCTPVGEIPGALTDGVNAIFVQAGDAASIATGLHAVLGNPVLRETLERNGRSIFQQQFSLSRFFESIARIHRKYIGISARQRETAQPAHD